MTVVVGVDGAGRSHRLAELAAAAQVSVIQVAGSVDDLPALTARLATARPGACLVLVDDAHRLSDQALRQLTAAARGGVAMALTRRPRLDRPALAELDQLVAGQGGVELLAPLAGPAMADLVATVTGQPAPAALVAAVRAASAGQPAIAVAVTPALATATADAPAGPAPALVARLQQRMALLDPTTVALARVLAFRLELTDQVLAAATGIATGELAPAMRTLQENGLLMPDREQLIPAVAQAIVADLAPAERRRLLDAVAQALVVVGGDPVAAATQLSMVRARTRSAGELYRAAADRLRFTDPAAALTWYDDATDAGLEAAAVAAGSAEAAALLGRPVEVDGPPVAVAQATRIALAAGASAAHQGRAGRAADALLATDPPGPLLAGPALVAIGRLDEARAAAASSGPTSLRRLAEAALATGEPGTALPLLIEAAEAIEATPPAVVLPDTPHALAAVVALANADAATAEHLLARALTAGVGGPVAGDRHRLLLAWVRMRTGRYDTALAELRRLDQASLPGRERLLAAALAAGIARRSGDIARLRDAWASAEPALARRAVDLFQLEPVEELLVAAARLRQHHQLAPALAALARIVDRLGRPAAWLVSVGWIRLQVAVASDDPAAATAAATQIAAAATDPTARRQQAQRTAAEHWARALAGEVDPAAVGAAADQLAAVQLPWEASRLAGQAAIRTTDAAAARRLLEHARELASVDPVTIETGADTSYGGLSDREVEVAQLVLDGRTYREIGGQLYLSPKTVEHHVARIRGKLGATSRAELIAALRRVFGESR